MPVKGRVTLPKKVRDEGVGVTGSESRCFAAARMPNRQNDELIVLHAIEEVVPNAPQVKATNTF
jgi:hypothetical protein